MGTDKIYLMKIIFYIGDTYYLDTNLNKIVM